MVIACGKGRAGAAELVRAMEAPEPSVRYWAATGLSNLAEEADAHQALLRRASKDASPTVRVAAARGLCRMGMLEEGLDVLIREMDSEDPWIRLAAAQALDELDEAARPAAEALRRACKEKQNNYVARVAERALADWEDREVAKP